MNWNKVKKYCCSFCYRWRIKTKSGKWRKSTLMGRPREVSIGDLFWRAIEIYPQTFHFRLRSFLSKQSTTIFAPRELSWLLSCGRIFLSERRSLWPTKIRIHKRNSDFPTAVQSPNKKSFFLTLLTFQLHFEREKVKKTWLAKKKLFSTNEC